MPGSPPFRLAHRYRWLLLLGLLFTLLLQWSALWLWARFEERHVLESNRQSMTQLAGRVQEQTARLLQAVETRLRLAEFLLVRYPGGDPLSDPAFMALLDEMPSVAGSHAPVRLISRSGQMDLSGLVPAGMPADVSRQRFFSVHQDQSQRALFIGATDGEGLFGKQGIPVSWPIRVAGSDWAAAFSFVELERLLQLYEPERMQPNGTVILMHLDGTILARVPYVADFIGKSVRDTPDYRNQLKRFQRGFYVSDSLATDHLPRFVGFERVGHYPLLAAVTAGEKDVLASWQRERGAVFLLGGMLSLVLIGLAGGLSLSLHNMHLAAQTLEQLATTDPLTGRLNRRAFFDSATREFERCQRYQTPLAVMMLDIDWFKKVNDTYGHAIGDNVLRTLAGAWFDALRKLDCIGRIGGEEFAMLLPQTTQEDALLLAERLRCLTETIDIAAPQGNFHVTVSIGLTCVRAHDSEFSQALERADAALYQAKQLGRNRVQGV